MEGIKMLKAPECYPRPPTRSFSGPARKSIAEYVIREAFYKAKWRRTPFGIAITTIIEICKQRRHTNPTFPLKAHLEFNKVMVTDGVTLYLANEKIWKEFVGVCKEIDHPELLWVRREVEQQARHIEWRIKGPWYQLCQVDTFGAFDMDAQELSKEIEAAMRFVKETEGDLARFSNALKSMG